ncbi:MAG: choice-of-anchor U domain-containing protein [Candidatus Saccharibacteria bacterium]
MPTGIVAGPDGNTWFTEAGGNNVGRITPSGDITEYAIPTPGSLSRFITIGPDGNLWFTEAGGNNVGRITPSGDITEFSILTPNSEPLGITIGPDGNLWFTETAGNNIGRITTSGVITEFPIPTQLSSPFGIIAGSDGNLWFTEAEGSNIGRITPAGSITEFPTPTLTSFPAGITSGSDGNLWFTENTGNNIGRITPAGTITEYPVPTSSSAPGFITTGIDGNMWFAEIIGNNVGRINAAGVITEYSIPSPGSSTFVVAAGQDNIWFAEAGTNNIGRLELPITTKTVNQPGGSPDIQLQTGDGTSITALSATAASSLPKTDTGQMYPLGLVNFTMTAPTGSTQVVNLTFETDLLPNQVTARKYHSSVQTFSDIPGAVITETTLNGHHALKLTYSITDGGSLDDDGAENGIIVDPVGLATTASSTGTGLANTGENLWLFLAAALAFTVVPAAGIIRNRTSRQATRRTETFPTPGVR